MTPDVDAAPLDYGTIRAHRLAAANVCSVQGCLDPVVAVYGRETFTGAGSMEFVVKVRLCMRHNTVRDTRFVIERT